MCEWVDFSHMSIVVVYFAVLMTILVVLFWSFFFFQAEDGIRDLVRSRGLGDVYKRQAGSSVPATPGV